MTQFLYATGAASPNQILQRMSSSDMDWVVHNLQQRFATHLNGAGNPLGRVYVSGSAQNAGSAVDTRRFARTGHASSFQGTGTQTISTRYFGQNRGATASVDTAYAPLYWTSDTLNAGNFRRSNLSGNLFSEIFSEVKSNMQSTSNQLGSYRIQASSPGTGWVSKGVVYTDTVYNGTYAIPSNISNTNYSLWLRTSGITAPTNTESNIMRWNGTAIEEVNIGLNSTVMSSFLLPSFINWAASNITYTMNTSNTGTNKGGVIDTRRSTTRNIQFNQNNYSSFPSGNAAQFRRYYFHLS